MPRIQSHGNYKARLPVFVIVIALVFGFSPIAGVLLRLTNGSFAPLAFSSLSLATQTELNWGVLAGQPIAVRLTNHTGQIKNYHWSAVQHGRLKSEGEKILADGQTTEILISSKGANAGQLRIALKGSNVFVTVTIRK